MSLEKRQHNRQGLHPEIAAIAFVVVLLSGLLGCSNPVANIPQFPQADLAGPRKSFAGSLSGGYKLIPYDQISIKFTYQPEYDSKVPILIQPDGNINVEGLGSIRAAGMTPDELGKFIAQKTSDRLRDPQVIVTILQYAPRKVFVGGEVKTPGPVEIREGMTPLQAIFDRGGFTTTAQIDSVVLIRDAGSNDPKIGRIDLAMALENASPESVTLLANDVIYVPMTGIGRVNQWVRQHLREIIPTEILGLNPYGLIR